MDARTGVLVWNYATTDNICAWPVVANGVAYVGAGQYPYAFDAASAALLWQYSLGSSYLAGPVTLVNGRLYVGSGSGCCDGYLYAFHLPGQ
jgi:outer membrane protein assembly factor BamB